MARADLLLALAEAAVTGDTVRSRLITEALAAEESEKKHTVLAERLMSLVADDRGTTSFHAAPRTMESADMHSPLEEVLPKRVLDELMLPQLVRDELRRLIAEQHQYELLRAFNLEPRHRILLVGPPGNGKTTCAEALATELSVPLLRLRYEHVITSFLGETATRLERVFQDVAQRRCVLLFDEFDVVAKERGDTHETGEIKRVVSGLLMQVDQLPSNVVFCAATNHPELLDRASWRRFELRLPIPSPAPEQRREFLYRCIHELRLDITRADTESLLAVMADASFSDIENVALDLLRKQVLIDEYGHRGLTPADIESTLQLWRTNMSMMERRPDTF